MSEKTNDALFFITCFLILMLLAVVISVTNPWDDEIFQSTGTEIDELQLDDVVDSDVKRIIDRDAGVVVYYTTNNSSGVICVPIEKTNVEP